MNAPSKELSEIIELAREAGKIVMSYREKGFSVSTKSNASDLVTEADHASNAFLYDALRKRFPDDALLLEETPERPRDYSGRVWMVDPIDGTSHFVAGRGGFSVMIGLLVDGRPELGVVYDPRNDVVYSARKGGDALRRRGGNVPERIRTSDRSRVADMTLIERNIRGEERPVDRLTASLGANLIMPAGGIGMRLMRLSEGAGDAIFCSGTRAMKWDYCAPQIILEEAGGRMTDFDGNPVDYLVPDEEFRPFFLASNGVLHDELLWQYKDFFQE